MKKHIDFIELAFEFPIDYPPPKAEDYFLYPAVIAKQMGMKTAIFTFRTPLTPLKKQVINGIDIFRFDSVFSLIRQLIKASPEIVHGHSFGWIPATFAPLLVRKCVFTPHLYRLDIYPKWKVELALWPLKKLDGIITRTAFEATQFRSIISESKIHIIPIPIDYDFFAQFEKKWKAEICNKYGLNATDNIVLSVANLRPAKNLRTLIRGFAIVKAKIPSSKLIIVGGDPVSNLSLLSPTKSRLSHSLELAGLANSLGIKNDVVLVGYQNADELRKFYAASQVFCMPSKVEGQLLAAGEAASAGLPLILSNLEPLVEIYRGCALFHEPMDYQSLASHIINVLCFVA